MTPEVISFVEKRWARAVKLGYSTRLEYGIGKLCSAYCVFPSHSKALLAKINWLEQGIEPHSQTLTGLQPAVTAEQLEANRP